MFVGSVLPRKEIIALSRANAVDRRLKDSVLIKIKAIYRHLSRSVEENDDTRDLFLSEVETNALSPDSNHEKVNHEE